jgi:hypothetical protein
MRHTSRVATTNVRALGQTAGAAWKNFDTRIERAEAASAARPKPNDSRRAIHDAFDFNVILPASRQREQKPLPHGDTLPAPCEPAKEAVRVGRIGRNFTNDERLANAVAGRPYRATAFARAVQAA